MDRRPPALDALLSPARPAGLVSRLVLANLLFNVLANGAFSRLGLRRELARFPGLAGDRRPGRLYHRPDADVVAALPALSIAFPLTTGLTVIGVQVIAAAALFRILPGSLPVGLNMVLQSPGPLPAPVDPIPA